MNKSNESVPNSVLSAWKRASNNDPKASEWDKHLLKVQNESGFHWRNGIYFKRLGDDSVRVTHFRDWNYTPNYSFWDIPANEWESIVSSVSNQSKDGGQHD